MDEATQTTALQVLNGHTSAETAYVVEDYPYGFRLRCKKRYWIEHKKNFGFRLVTQTTNPKKIGNPWNKPHAEQYVSVTAALYLDSNGHVQFTSLDSYSSSAKAEKFLQILPVEGIALESLQKFITMRKATEEKKALRDAIGLQTA